MYAFGVMVIRIIDHKTFSINKSHSSFRLVDLYPDLICVLDYIERDALDAIKV